MFKKLDLGNNATQYFIGLSINVVFLIVLYSSSTSNDNLQIPKGVYQNNIWQCSDVNTYVDPAKNFIERGVFGKDKEPDHFRTIGYPALISFFISVFGQYWLIALQIFQAIIFALIYPLISSTVKLLFTDYEKGFEKTVFLLLCISGTYFTRSPAVLTDILFTLLFIGGFYCGLKSYISKNYNYLLLYLALITVAALVRPTLALMPLLNVIMGYFVAVKFNFALKRMIIRSLYVSLAIFVLTNISTVRNYYNYGFASPSSVIGVNASHYLAKKILEKEGKLNEFSSKMERIEAVNDISLKTSMRKELMVESVLKYPLTAINVLVTNTINVFLENNLLSAIAPYYGFQWKAYKNSCFDFKTNRFLYFSSYFIMLLYAILWALFFLKLILLLREKDYSTFVLIVALFIMFIIPAVLTGDGGGRFRLPFEHILIIFGMSLFSKRKPLKNQVSI